MAAETHARPEEGHHSVYCPTCKTNFVICDVCYPRSGRGLCKCPHRRGMSACMVDEHCDEHGLDGDSCVREEITLLDPPDPEEL